jgi:AraC-like DNA-binding protein
MGCGFGAIRSNRGQAGIGYYVMEGLPPGPYLVAATDVEPSRLRDDTELMERARAGAVPIAMSYGFTNHSHFSRVFRAHYQTTPRQYRRRAQQLI